MLLLMLFILNAITIQIRFRFRFKTIKRERKIDDDEISSHTNLTSTEFTLKQLRWLSYCLAAISCKCFSRSSISFGVWSHVLWANVRKVSIRQKNYIQSKWFFPSKLVMMVAFEGSRTPFLCRLLYKCSVSPKWSIAIVSSKWQYVTMWHKSEKKSRTVHFMVAVMKAKTCYCVLSREKKDLEASAQLITSFIG